jgi:chitinase
MRLTAGDLPCDFRSIQRRILAPASRLAIFVLCLFSTLLTPVQAQPLRIIGYYAGPPENVQTIHAEKLTHLIFCFGGLKGADFALRSAADTQCIRNMVALKQQNPRLRVMLSLGGWGGCASCSEVFSSDENRHRFAESVREITDYFQTDGIDLDWEYPVVSGFPGHRRHPDDKDNFSALLKALHEANPPPFEISFAAGGYTAYIDSAIDWTAIQPYTDFINIMSYDLVHGYSRTSGHHTPLYSTPQQTESTDHAVKLLLQKGVPSPMLVIGAAFYGRYFRIDEGNPINLYQPCRFDHAFSYAHAADSLSEQNGFRHYWDNTAQAPYALNEKRALLATYDDERSVALKTRYALQHSLGGIMFWQLMDDLPQQRLLKVIHGVGEVEEKSER